MAGDERLNDCGRASAVEGTRRRRGPRQHQVETALISDLAHDGRGVAHVDGKTVFIDDALPGERVEWIRLKRGRSFDEGRLVQVLERSADRVTPRCGHFGVCGGCALQHLSPVRQIEFKQRQLNEALSRIGKVTPLEMLAPLQTDVWNYRRRARLAARWVPKKNRTVVGFRERSTPYVADLQRCEVLQAPMDALIEPLSRLLSALSIRNRVPQVEVAVADTATALVIRVLEPPSAPDLGLLREFANEHRVRIYLQPGGHETVALLRDEAGGTVAGGAAEAAMASLPDTLCSAPPLEYHLPGHDLKLKFIPTDFVQVNGALNRAMIERAMTLLSPAAGERILDLYCGLGNFSLPLARSGAQVVGVEGEAALVARARGNAASNGLVNAQFHVANLADETLAQHARQERRRFEHLMGTRAGTGAGAPEGAWEEMSWAARAYEKVLLDPPRAGAREVLEVVADCGAGRVLYISCHPGSLARDAGILVNEHGFTLQAAGVMDMFPHTAHVESVALFVR